jgi:DUF3048 family protein
LRPHLVAGAGFIAAVAVLAGCFHRPAPLPSPPPRPSPSPTAPHVSSPLNGMPVPPGSVKHRVTAVMIDNYPHETRPQSGLRDADIVYEVEAEGGITRYMALFLEKTPSKIGPVRSARLYFVDLARPYSPYFAHAGENDDVWEPLKELRVGGFADLEEIQIAEEAFWRDPTRNMPHNLYTSIARIRASGPQHGWTDTPFARRGFRFSASPAVTQAPGITIDTWMHYSERYIFSRGAYIRTIGGVVQHDLDDPAPYRVSDVIVGWVPATVIDSLGDLKMDVYGDYPAVLVRDGVVREGTWSAAGPTSLPRLLDAKGLDMPLAPGQIYIEILPQGSRVTVGNQTWQH